MVALDLSFLAVCLLWTAVEGKDLNWDLRNYHYYLPYSLLNERISRDFLPASLQSYLNPLAYLPFYGMVRGEWPSFVISAVMASIHGFNLILLRRIACRLFKDPVQIFAAFVLGALSPIFWVEVGTSFNDVTISIFILLGVLFCLKSLDEEKTSPLRPLLLAGVFFGIATALKITMGIFAASAMIFVVWPRHSAPQYIRRFFAFAAGGVIGFVAFGGYWAWQLWSAFGNPVFPLFNGIFRSPDYFPRNIEVLRFIPGSILAALYFPFEMATPIAWVYTETSAADLRYAVITCLSVASIVYAAFRYSRRGVWWGNQSSDVASRVVVFVLVSFVLWGVTSANGRYGIPMALLLGVVIVQLLKRLKSQLFNVTVAVLIVLQSTQMFLTTDRRWSAAGWGDSWFEMDVPAQLKENPYLYLSVGKQSNSFVAPFLHPDSAFVNIIGQASLTASSSENRKLLRLLKEFDGRTRILTGVTKNVKDGSFLHEAYIPDLNVLVARFGIEVNQSDCKFLSSASAGQSLATNSESRYFMLSCDVKHAVWPTSEMAKLVEANKIMDLVELTCPRLFDPKQPNTDQNSRGFKRFYVGSEIDLQISPVGHVFVSKVHVLNDYDFGKAEDWLSGRMENFKCPRRQRSSPWFSLDLQPEMF